MYRRKMLPSGLTNTIEYVHWNEAHFTYIYVYHSNVFEADNIYKKPSPKCHFTYICFYVFFCSGAPPMTFLTDGALTDPQLPVIALNV